MDPMNAASHQNDPQTETPLEPKPTAPTSPWAIRKAEALRIAKDLAPTFALLTLAVFLRARQSRKYAEFNRQLAHPIFIWNGPGTPMTRTDEPLPKND